MNFVVSINTDNAAFEGPEGVEELNHLLNVVAQAVALDSTLAGGLSLRDINGNWVGYAGWKEEDLNAQPQRH